MHRFDASFAVLVLPVLLFSATSRSAECVVERVFDCNGIKCSDGTNAVKLFIDDAHSTISRCDSKGCDQFSVQLAQLSRRKLHG